MDELDKALVAELSMDGRISVPKLSEKLGVTTPTVRSRLNRLLESGKVKIAALTDHCELEGAVVALVGVNLSKYNLKKNLDHIASLDEVNWCAVCTGRYDMLVEVTTTQGMQGLYDFLNDKLSMIGEIQSSETFVVMRARRKWSLLPEGLKRIWRGKR
jgi:Lrp/AsnC family transcriptional regulator for asnA, asnC and gidA